MGANARTGVVEIVIEGLAGRLGPLPPVTVAAVALSGEANPRLLLAMPHRASPVDVINGHVDALGRCQSLLGNASSRWCCWPLPASTPLTALRLYLPVSVVTCPSSVIFQSRARVAFWLLPNRSAMSRGRSPLGLRSSNARISSRSR